MTINDDSAPLTAHVTWDRLMAAVLSYILWMSSDLTFCESAEFKIQTSAWKRNENKKQKQKTDGKINFAFAPHIANDYCLRTKF